MNRFGVWALFVAVITSGCNDAAAPATSTDKGADTTKFVLTSSAGSTTLPTTYTCDGQSMSPPLAWSGAPSGTKEFALIMSTIPAPGSVKFNWVLYHIPASQASIEAGRSAGVIGFADDGAGLSYAPPCSQGAGLKQYIFTLYALSGPPALGTLSGAQVTGAALLNAMSGVTIATASLTLGVTRTLAEFKTDVPAIDLNVIAARPTASSATLSVFSATARNATVTLQDGSTFSQTLRAGEATNIDISGLAADRMYQYRIDASGKTIDGQFRTARESGSSFRFDIQADSHLDTNSDVDVYKATLANVLADTADFLIDLGDTFMSDKYTDFHDAAPQYYAQRYYFGLVGAKMPVFLVQGNHDGELGWLPENSTWAAGMRNKYFSVIEPNGFYNTTSSTRNYYAWSWGDATFIVLDPYTFTTVKPNSTTAWTWTLGKEQYDWLESTLRRASSRYIFVFIHHLVGGRGADARGGAEASRYFEWGGSNLDGTSAFAAQRTGWSKPIHDLLVQYHVSAVFHGHDHLYAYQQRDNLVYQEVPQPSTAREGNTSAIDYGYLSGTIFSSSGHLRVTVTPARATVEYVRARLATGNGSIVDRYAILPSRP